MKKIDNARWLSIIIPIYNNSMGLRKTLESLSHQSFVPDFEIIVIDDGSKEKIDINQFNNLHQNLSVIRQIHLGIAAARNLGIRQSTSENLLFIDSDCRLEENTLHDLYVTMKEYPDEIAFQLRITGDKSYLVGQAERIRLEAVQKIIKMDNGHILSVNTSGFSVRKHFAEKYNEFFNSTYVNGEDTDILIKLVESGFLPKYIPEGTVQHCPMLSPTKYIIKHFKDGYYSRPVELIIKQRNLALSMKQKLKVFFCMYNIAFKNRSFLALIVTLCAYLIELIGRFSFTFFGMMPGRIGVLSIDIDPIRESELLSKVLSASQTNQGLCIAAPNAWTLVLAKKDPSFAELLKSFDVVYADGMGVVLSLFLTKLKIIRKVTANNFFERLCEEASNRALSLAFIGSKEEVVRIVTEKLSKKLPKLNIVICSSGYLSKYEEQKILAEMVEKKPNLVFVGRGQPLQEKWVATLRQSLPETVFFCTGALFDYMAGRSHYAPRLARSLGFEWLFRLAYNPRTCWKRYLIGLPMLGCYIVNDMLCKSLRIFHHFFMKDYRVKTNQ